MAGAEPSKPPATVHKGAPRGAGPMTLGASARLLHSGLEGAAERFGSGDALLVGERRITFAELEFKSGGFARHLADHGVSSGSRVAVMMSNRPEFVVAVEAVSKLGATSVLLSPAWKALEVGHGLDITGADHAVCDDSTADVISERLGGHRVTNVDMVSPQGASFSGSDVDPSCDAILVFSSGTTGLPKAARHTHATITAAVDQWRQSLELSRSDRFQVATPSSHILGLLNLLTAIEVGAAVRLHRRFDLAEVLRCIESDRLTLEMAVAPIALAMANHPRLEDYDLSSLRYIMWGATPVTPAVAEVVTRRTGVRWLPAYGATELPVIAANPVSRPDEWRLDSAGLPAPGVEMRVVDLDTGRPVPPGSSGEIQVKGPSLMVGYLPAEANAEVLSDGWYRTGDVGFVEPDGWVHLTDRAKEMIKVNGFQVAPAEIEAILQGHAGVVDCAVFGIPDPAAGELPAAAVQLDPRRAPDVNELMKLVATSLASYKQLRHVVVVESIPRLPSGKVLRRELRDRWAPTLGTVA